jgi:transposase-like protein
MVHLVAGQTAEFLLTRDLSLTTLAANVVQRGKTDTGNQRYQCQSPDCSYQSFLFGPAYRGRLSEINQQVLEKSLNGSGVRAAGRVLNMSIMTVIHEVKNKSLHSAPSTNRSERRSLGAVWTASFVGVTTQKAVRGDAL